MRANGKQITAMVATAVAVVAIVFLCLDDDTENAPAVTAPRADVPRQNAKPAAVALPKPEKVTPSISNAVAAVRVIRANAWADALGTNRLAAAEKALRDLPPERDLTEAESALVDEAHKLAAAEDAEGARAFAAARLKAGHPKVREAAVFALAHCGANCMTELTPFLLDPDEGVRIEAVSAWRAAYFELENGPDKASAAVMAMCVLDDAEALEPIARQLIAMDRDLAAEALGTVLDEGTPAGRAVAEQMAHAIIAE